MPFLLTIISGLSTLVGACLIFFIRKKTDRIILSSLAFAAGVMLTVCLTDLIPESFNFISTTYNNNFTILIILLFINIGIILSMLIDKYLPNNDNDLYRVGIVSMIAIILHNIPEGMVTFITTDTDISLGIVLTLAITAHNIPEGITIALPIFYSTGSKKKALFYTLISGLSELFGGILVYIFLKPFINNFIIGILFSIITGIMFHISIYELLPLSLKYKKGRGTILFFIIGIIIIYLNHILIN